MVKKKKVTEKVVEFILTRKREELKNLTLQKIAQNVGVNIFYLFFRFIIDQRITIPDFILREKMHEAYFILGEDEKKSITELSRELGFLKVEDFDVEFQKCFAINPEKFRDIRSCVSKKKLIFAR